MDALWAALAAEKYLKGRAAEAVLVKAKAEGGRGGGEGGGGYRNTRTVRGSVANSARGGE